jgi:hypothetical protein
MKDATEQHQNRWSKECLEHAGNVVHGNILFKSYNILAETRWGAAWMFI